MCLYFFFEKRSATNMITIETIEEKQKTWDDVWQGNFHFLLFFITKESRLDYKLIDLRRAQKKWKERNFTPHILLPPFLFYTLLDFYFIILLSFFLALALHYVGLATYLLLYGESFLLRKGILWKNFRGQLEDFDESIKLR